MEETPEHEMLFLGFGVRIAIKFKRDGPFRGSTQLCRNITEIHYDYPLFPVGTLKVRKIFPPEKEAHTISVTERKRPTGKVAFESDVHQMGVTYYIGDLESFAVLKKETRPACPFRRLLNQKRRETV